MFTGLVEEMGTVRGVTRGEDSFTLEIGAGVVLDDVKLGDSIAVNGVCLSVTEFGADWFRVGLAPETLRRTDLGDLTEGMRVNLERSVLPTTRMGGHYVQGHVDGTGRIASFEREADALWVRIETDPALMKYVVEKGYVAVDGTSLTVVETGADWFTLTLVAHTQPLIVLPTKAPGDRVNIEADIMAKYAEKILEARR
ncbi:riboflavin synthase [Parvularcula dongshanensis]|uniref:Riboflavin synthase n=1 Tax=Parvularcula dongshanensis TaxID=1173995 RepID=A0A840I5B7_9PROT|nr:riboflavin synthase [Parvularcula dongshanensis]MBB4660039.1 riboflavin synthase [Parvularcula dongshanensis]